MQATLGSQSKLAGWTTPRVSDDNISRYGDASMEREIARENRGASLAIDAHMAGWPTPCAMEPGTDPEQVWARKQRLTEETGVYRGNDCGLGSKVHLAGWPTCAAWDGEGGGQAARAMNPERSNDLPDFAMLAGWTTPQAHDTNPRGAGNRGNPKAGNACLAWDARAAGWPTPMAGSPGTEDYNPAGNTDSSRRTVALAGWPTPTRQDEASSGRHTTTTGRSHPGTTLTDAVDMAGPARITADGQLLTGSTAGTESGGQLSPLMSAWLMGYPTSWCEAAVKAFQAIKNTSKRRR
jgi:hypothetical protein